MDVLEAIRTRRSIRKYKPEPVDDKALETVLEAARLAPSWANSQCWRFVVVRDSGVRAGLAGSLRENNPAREAILNAPVLIVACAELGKAGYRHGHGELATDKGDWFMFDVALAMQNLVLAAHSLGLGTVHVGSFDAKKAASILGVPQGFCVVSMTPLGYPDQEPAVRPRRELGEIVFYERFGAVK